MLRFINKKKFKNKQKIGKQKFIIKYSLANILVLLKL